MALSSAQQSAFGYPINPFTQFVSNAPLANPLGLSDQIPVIQGGLTKRFPVSEIPGLQPIVIAPTTLITSGTSYSILPGDYFIGIELGAPAPFTVNLPGTAAVGRTLIIKDTNGNCSGADPITLAGATIDGNSGWPLVFPYQYITIQAIAATVWSIIGLRPG